MTPQEEAKKAQELKESRQRKAQEDLRRQLEMSTVLQRRDVTELLVGDEGYLGTLERDYLADLEDAEKTPVNNLVMMAVALTRWRDIKGLRKQLCEIRDKPPLQTEQKSE